MPDAINQHAHIVILQIFLGSNISHVLAICRAVKIEHCVTPRRRFLNFHWTTEIFPAIGDFTFLETDLMFAPRNLRRR
jgi:hypothetical protein